MTSGIEISPMQARDMLGRADVVLLDCRTPGERAAASIEGSRFIPLNEIPARVGEIADARDQSVVVYCHGGVRSLRAARWLREQGFAKAVSMAGGIDAWSLEVDPKVPRY